MSIQFPENRKEISDRAKSDVQAELPDSNPFLENSYLGAIVSAFAGRIFDFYLQLKELIKQMFPDTATEDFLLRWGEYVGLSRNPATSAEGQIVATGTASSVIPNGTVYQNTDGLQYITQASKTIENISQSITSLTRSGSLVTAITASDHDLATGLLATIAGAAETDYNGSFTLTVVDATTFTYDITGTPSTPATGSPTVDFDGALLDIQSSGTGQSFNLLGGASVTLFSPIAGIDNAAFVTFGEIGGGTDIESDTDLRARIIDRYANPIALFNVSAIENQAKLVAGVTRVFVEEITPFPGAVTIYFTRDNDDNIIPAASEVAEVKAKILEIKPAHTEDSDVVVLAPTGITTNFIFTALSPNTSTMQTAIIASLEVLFEESTSVSEDLLEVAYEAAIFQTIDPETGNQVSNFTLSTPSGNISIASGELPVLGSVTFT